MRNRYKLLHWQLIEFEENKELEKFTKLLVGIVEIKVR